jgi:hypothetical protein
LSFRDAQLHIDVQFALPSVRQLAQARTPSSLLGYGLRLAALAIRE